MPVLPGAVARARASEPIVPETPRLFWLGDAGGTAFYRGGALTVRARARTDWYNDPGGVSRNGSAPALVFALDADCALAARVRVQSARHFDAAFLFVHQSAQHYAKLGLEHGAAPTPRVVSVVTRDVADEAVGPAAEGPAVRLRVTRRDAVIAFHCAQEKDKEWALVRVFRFPDPAAPTQIGFAAQSPVGRGCTARFDEISYVKGSRPDPRVCDPVQE